MSAVAEKPEVETTTEFSLRRLVHEVAAEATSVEYADIAADVMARLDPSLLVAALEQALPLYVRAVSVSDRGRGSIIQPPAAGPSAKVAAIRDDWQRRLAEIYPTPKGNKRLADLTYSDLMYQAQILQASAEATLAKAKGWEKLARAVRKERAATVRDLSPEILSANLKDVA